MVTVTVTVRAQLRTVSYGNDSAALCKAAFACDTKFKENNRFSTTRMACDWHEIDLRLACVSCIRKLDIMAKLRLPMSL